MGKGLKEWGKEKDKVKGKENSKGETVKFIMGKAIKGEIGKGKRRKARGERRGERENGKEKGDWKGNTKRTKEEERE